MAVLPPLLPSIAHAHIPKCRRAHKYICTSLKHTNENKPELKLKMGKLHLNSL